MYFHQVHEKVKFSKCTENEANNYTKQYACNLLPTECSMKFSVPSKSPWMTSISCNLLSKGSSNWTCVRLCSDSNAS